MRWHRIYASTVVTALAISALIGGPATADPGSLTAEQNYRVVPWSGTITVEWREERGYCPTAISCAEIDSGKLVYTITGANPTTQSPDWASYQATAEGSGTINSRYVSVYGTEVCNSAWTANNGRVDGLRIGVTAPTIGPGSVMVEDRVVDGDPGQCTPGSEVVGDFPSDGIGDGPDNEPYIQRQVNDVDPDPNILRGTTTFAAQPNWDALKAYTYTLSYDLNRQPDECPARPGVQKLQCRPTWITLKLTKSGVRVTPGPKGTRVLINWGPVGSKGKGGFRPCSGACFIDLPKGTWWMNAQIKATATLLPSRVGMRPVKIAK